MVLALLLSLWAQNGDELYWPGKQIYAEQNNGALHGKARVAAVNGDQIEVEFYRYDKLETLESLTDLGPVVDRRTFTRQQLDRWNAPRYEIFVSYKGNLWPKAQIVGQNGDMFDVQIYDGDGKPSERIQVSRAEILRYNVPVYPKDGESVGGIRMDYTDPTVQEALGKLQAIVDKHRAAIEGAPSVARRVAAQKALAYELFVEYKRLGIEHDGNLVPADKPTGNERRSALRSDPSGNTLGAYIRSKVGVCSEQAALYVGLMAKSGAPELGLHVQRISTYHSEVLARFADGSHWIQDMTGARGVPVPGRNFAGLSETAGKPPEVGWHKGPSGLGLVRSVYVDTQFDPAKGEIPARVALSNPDRIVTDLTPGVFDRARSRVRTEAVGAGKFAAAWLLKEAFWAVETRDPVRMREAAGQLKTLDFWANLATFTVASRGAEKLLPLRGLARKVVPLTVGVAAVNILNGNYSPKDLAITTGSFLAAGAAVNLFADGAIYPMLFRAGPPGWVAAAAYSVAKLAVTLYAGEKLEGWIHSLFEEPDVTTTGGSKGIKQKIDGLLEE